MLGLVEHVVQPAAQPQQVLVRDIGMAPAPEEQVVRPPAAARQAAVTRHYALTMGSGAALGALLGAGASKLFGGEDTRRAAALGAVLGAGAPLVSTQAARIAVLPLFLVGLVLSGGDISY
jgi:hypothetical protein